LVDDMKINDISSLFSNVEIKIDESFEDIDLGDKLWIISAFILNKIEKIKNNGLDKKKIKLIKESIEELDYIE